MSERVRLVATDLPIATRALLSGDPQLAAIVAAREEEFAGATVTDEARIASAFARHQPVARDLRLLLFGLQAVPQLERCHDLVEHIAQGASANLSCFSEEGRQSLAQMATATAAMWQTLDAAMAADGAVHDELVARDRELDQLRDAFVQCVGRDCGDRQVAIELALVARFYERLGDHAVCLAARLEYLVIGTQPEAVPR